MININKFGVGSENKTYASVKTCTKAIEELAPLIGDKVIRFMIVKLEEHNCENPKYFGRFIPVAIGIDAIDCHLHQTGCYIVG